MKVSNNLSMSALTSRTLKVVGIIFCLSFLLNLIVFFIPGGSANLFSRPWLMTFSTQLVDRGIIPMIGVAFLLTGHWVESTYGMNLEKDSPLFDLRFWGVVLASILGAVYLLLIPLILMNVGQELQESLTQINQQATQAESQINAQMLSPQYQQQIASQQTQLKSQLSGILGDEKKYQEALVSPQIPEEFKTLLKASKTDPKALDKFLAQKAQDIPNQLLGEVRTRKEQLEREARAKSRNISWQTGISSLLLAIGYIIIGWSGLKGLLSYSPKT